MAEAVVHPDARRRGTGSALVRIGLAEGGAGARVWAHGDLEPARATASALDLVAARELLQMRRPLADLPAAQLSDGVVLRTYAGSDDDAELLRVNNAAFSWHPEQGGWSEADVAERRGESWSTRRGCSSRSTRRPAGCSGSIGRRCTARLSARSTSSASTPDAQGRGLGRALTLVGLHHLADRLGPAADVTLYVEGDNAAAVKTYRRLDFDVFARDVAYTVR